MYVPYVKMFHWKLNYEEFNYRQVSNIRRGLVGNWIVDHSDVVGDFTVIVNVQKWFDKKAVAFLLWTWASFAVNIAYTGCKQK